MRSDVKYLVEPTTEPDVVLTWVNPVYWLENLANEPFGCDAENGLLSYAAGVVTFCVMSYGPESVILTRDCEEGWIIPLSSVSLECREMRIRGGGLVIHEALIHGSTLYHKITLEVDDLGIAVIYVKCHRSKPNSRGY